MAVNRGAAFVIARIAGPARALLSAERVALNYLCHLSGVATETAKLVSLVAGTGARICCTRKTTPGLRAFEKYAVRCGGGANHRFGLDDAILIKDNHIAVAGGVAEAIRRARAFAGHLVKVEVEVTTPAEAAEAWDAGARFVMCDNMSVPVLAETVGLLRGKASAAGEPVEIEATGGLTLEVVRDYAATGVDFVSVGGLTHSSPIIDLALDLVD